MEYLYSCEICNQIFSRKCKLDHHVLSHLKEYEEDCDAGEISDESGQLDSKREDRKSKGSFMSKYVSHDKDHDPVETIEEERHFDFKRKGGKFRSNYSSLVEVGNSDETFEEPPHFDSKRKVGPSKESSPKLIGQSQNLNTEENSFICDVCKKGFPRSDLLSHHMILSHGEMFSRHEHGISMEKPNYCKLCMKSFPTSNSLKNHESHHRLKSKYACDVCHLRFRYYRNLWNHAWVHCEEKPYVCDTCGRGFGRFYRLKNHMSVHSNSRPYKCKYCEKSFKLALSLKDHQKCHHINIENRNSKRKREGAKVTECAMNITSKYKRSEGTHEKTCNSVKQNSLGQKQNNATLPNTRARKDVKGLKMCSKTRYSKRLSRQKKRSKYVTKTHVVSSSDIPFLSVWTCGGSNSSESKSHLAEIQPNTLHMDGNVQNPEPYQDKENKLDEYTATNIHKSYSSMESGNINSAVDGIKEERFDFMDVSQKTLPQIEGNSLTYLEQSKIQLGRNNCKSDNPVFEQDRSKNVKCNFRKKPTKKTSDTSKKQKIGNRSKNEIEKGKPVLQVGVGKAGSSRMLSLKVRLFTCVSCHKIYKHRSSLARHRKSGCGHEEANCAPNEAKNRFDTPNRKLVHTKDRQSNAKTRQGRKVMQKLSSKRFNDIPNISHSYTGTCNNRQKRNAVHLSFGGAPSNITNVLHALSRSNGHRTSPKQNRRVLRELNNRHHCSPVRNSSKEASSGIKVDQENIRPGVSKSFLANLPSISNCDFLPNVKPSGSSNGISEDSRLLGAGMHKRGLHAENNYWHSIMKHNKPTCSSSKPYQKLHEGKDKLHADAREKKMAMEKVDERHFMEASNPNFICRFCNKGYASHSSLNRHLETHYRKLNPKDNTAVLPNAEESYDHGVMKNDNCSLDCKTHESVGPQGSLKRHVRPYKCESCAHRFASPQNLLKHTNKGDCQPSFKCRICKKKFFGRLLWEQHMQEENAKIPKKQFACKCCSTVFFKRLDLSVHKITMKCSVCEKKFNCSYSFEVHMKTSKCSSSCVAEIDSVQKYFQGEIQTLLTYDDQNGNMAYEIANKGDENKKCYLTDKQIPFSVQQEVYTHVGGGMNNQEMHPHQSAHCKEIQTKYSSLVSRPVRKGDMNGSQWNSKDDQPLANSMDGGSSQQYKKFTNIQLMTEIVDYDRCSSITKRGKFIDIGVLDEPDTLQTQDGAVSSSNEVIQNNNTQQLPTFNTQQLPTISSQPSSLSSEFEGNGYSTLPRVFHEVFRYTSDSTSITVLFNENDGETYNESGSCHSQASTSKMAEDCQDNVQQQHLQIYPEALLEPQKCTASQEQVALQSDCRQEYNDYKEQWDIYRASCSVENSNMLHTRVLQNLENGDSSSNSHNYNSVYGTESLHADSAVFEPHNQPLASSFPLFEKDTCQVQVLSHDDSTAGVVSEDTVEENQILIPPDGMMQPYFAPWYVNVITDEIHLCPVCGVTFSSLVELENHQMTH